jgi:hypothetical protein
MSKLLHLQRAGVLTSVALAAALAAGTAHAQIVYSGVLNLAIPNTTAGLYVNVVNGSTFTGPGTFPAVGGPGANFDFNLFGSSAWTLFSPTTSGQSAPTPVPLTSRGYASVSSNGAALNLAVGTPIDSLSIWNTGSPSGVNLSTGSEAIFGFRFRNEGTDLASALDDTVHFGWARVILSGGSPGTLVDYAFEATPLTGIQAGVVPEPSTYALFAAGLAGLLAWSRRRLR